MEDRRHASGTVIRRPYNSEISLSVVGCGGIVLMGMPQNRANNLIAESFDRGVNYYDVAPSYGDGEAEKKLGKALKPMRDRIFLACKTMRRDSSGVQKELNSSLKRLQTEYFDLYQFHAVTEKQDVQEIFAHGGAAEVVLKARDQGVIRYIGFSAHTERAALDMMERMKFDSILFPFNFVCYSQGNFGPRVLRQAKERGVARLALKALALTPRTGGDHAYPKCWYRPVDDQELVEKALRFTLSEDVTSAIPPGDEKLYRMALNVASDVTPLTLEEKESLLAFSEGLEPLFRE